jgi:hypothetical protein
LDGNTRAGGLRFLHIEAISNVWTNDTVTTSNVTWKHVNTALRSAQIWGACNMTCNPSDTSCTLGGSHTRYTATDSCP